MSTEVREDEPQKRWSRIGAQIEAFQSTIRSQPIDSRADKAGLRKEFAHYDFALPTDIDDLTQDVFRLFERYSPRVPHRRYFGPFNSAIRDARIVGETVAAVFNTQLSAWSNNPLADALEQRTLSCFSEFLGFPKGESISHFTTSGAEANLDALITALADKCPAWSTEGVRGIGIKPRIYLSADGDDSFRKAVRLCGLGTDCIRRLQTHAPAFTFHISDLRSSILKDIADGFTPLMIIATAGTTRTGAIDPIADSAEVAKDYGARFHVDGAWGGAIAMSRALRPLLTGIEHADSVSLDVHNWLGAPPSAGMLFCRRRLRVRPLSSLAADDLSTSDDGNSDTYRTTPQSSHRAIGLKVFMALTELGIEGATKLVEHQVAMGILLRARLREHKFIVLNDADLPVVCFTHPEIESRESGIAEVLASIHERNRVWISEVPRGAGKNMLRACVTHSECDPSDIDALIDEMEIALNVRAECSKVL